MDNTDDRQLEDSACEESCESGEYYLRARGRVIGPCSASAVAKLIKRGVISRLDEISCDQVSWENVNLDKYAHECGTNSRIVKPAQPPASGSISSLKAGGREESSASLFSPTRDAQESARRANVEAAQPTYMLWVGGAGFILLCVVAVICALSLHDVHVGREAQIDNAIAGAPKEGSTTRLVVAATAPLDRVVINASYGSGSFVASAKDESEMADAVGLVVSGFEFTPPGMEGDKTIERAIVSGSCFMITSAGDVVTNKHVVELIEKAKHDPTFQEMCRQELGTTMKPCVWAFFAGVKYAAEIKYSSDKFDLAILKIPRTASSRFRMSASSKLSRGQDVFALGFPGIAQSALSVDELKHQALFEMGDDPDVRSQFKERDFQFTLTKGALGRVVSEASGQCWIQHEAVVRHGNSGGPLIDANGLVLGINTRIQKNDEGDVQTNMALGISQLRTEIESHTTGTVWITPPTSK